MLLRKACVSDRTFRGILQKRGVCLGAGIRSSSRDRAGSLCDSAPLRLRSLQEFATLPASSLDSRARAGLTAEHMVSTVVDVPWKWKLAECAPARPGVQFGSDALALHSVSMAHWKNAGRQAMVD